MNCVKKNYVPVNVVRKIFIGVAIHSYNDYGLLVMIQSTIKPYKI